MMIPGGNVLKLALSVISKQTVSYYAFESRSVNEIGMEVSEYDDPVDISGSFQPVPRAMYEQYGLELSKDYSIFYTPNNVGVVDRGVSGDKIEFAGRTWQCESNVNWFNVDGWAAILVCAITS